MIHVSIYAGPAAQKVRPVRLWLTILGVVKKNNKEIKIFIYLFLNGHAWFLLTKQV